jgi:hypothetical protein
MFSPVDITLNVQLKIARLQPLESRKMALPSAFPWTRSTGRERKLHYITLPYTGSTYEKYTHLITEKRFVLGKSSMCIYVFMHVYPT